MKPRPLALVALLALAVPGAAAGHGVHGEVERRGAEVAVRARYEDGRPLAGARFEVISPAAPGAGRASGRTDRDGWVTFVPDAPGVWSVRIVDAGGHGRVVTVNVAATATATAAPASTATPTAPAPPAEDTGPGTLVPTLAGVGVVALVFGGAYALGRRRRAAGR